MGIPILSKKNNYIFYFLGLIEIIIFFSISSNPCVIEIIDIKTHLISSNLYGLRAKPINP
jgi:hypothetical protein